MHARGAGRFEGKVAVVTGAGAGIGRAAALAFAREGACVVVADIDERGGSETVDLLRTEGATSTFVYTDVSDGDDVKALCSRAVEAYGGLDCAFNNAGVIGETGSLLADVSEENWSRVLAVNLTGVFLCMKYEIPRMLASGGGAIVNASSSVGLVGDRTYAAYVASKHGVIGATRAAALEYAALGIRVNAVCPGVTRTEMVEALIAADPGTEATLLAREPIGRLASPTEVAGAVLWLCSEEASFVAGHALAVDGGQVIQ